MHNPGATATRYSSKDPRRELEYVVQLVRAGQWEQALKVALFIQDESIKGQAQQVVAEYLAKAGQWEQALEIAHSIQDQWVRGRAQQAVVEYLIKTGQWEQALEAAHSIQEQAAQGRAKQAVTTYLAKIGQWEQALEIARSISFYPTRSAALYRVTEELAKAGQWEQALEIAYSTQDQRVMGRAQQAVAEYLAKAGQWEQALEIAGSVESEIHRDRALQTVAEYLATVGRWEQALKVALFIQDESIKGRAQQAVAEYLAKAGQWEQALEIARAIDFYAIRRDALYRVVEELAKAGQWEQALEVARSIQHVSLVDWLLEPAPGWRAKSSQPIDFAHTVEDRTARGRALRAIVEHLAKAGQWEQALEVTSSIEDEAYKMQAHGIVEEQRALFVQKESELKATMPRANEGTTLRIRIVEVPLLTPDLVQVLATLTRIHTELWLVARRRFADFIRYVQTYDPVLEREAHLVIERMKHNSPAEIEFKFDASPQGVAEALRIAIDAFSQAGERRKEIVLKNETSAAEIRQKEQESQSALASDEQKRRIELQQAQATLADQEQARDIAWKMAELDLKRSEVQYENELLEGKRRQIEYQRELLAYDRDIIKRNLELVGQIIDVVYPNGDPTNRIMLMQGMLPILLQGEGQQVLIQVLSLHKPINDVIKTEEANHVEDD